MVETEKTSIRHILCMRLENVWMVLD